MISTKQIDDLAGHTMLGADGEKIGKIGEVYLDDTTGQPEWVTVNTGLFGSAQSFVPLSAATVTGGDLQVSYGKDMIKGAPRVGDDGHLSPTDEDELYRYYNLGDNLGDGNSTSGSDDLNATGARFDTTGTAGTAGTARTAGTPGVTGTTGRTETTDNAMTRSEEELTVGTRTREAGRARLRKHVVTERQTVTVPVSHEEIALEREPITNAAYDAATRGAAISEEEHEIVLHEEVPVVSKDVHAVERVALGTQTVTEQREVTDEVRKERIEMENLDADTARTDTTRTAETDTTTMGTKNRKH